MFAHARFLCEYITSFERNVKLVRIFTLQRFFAPSLSSVLALSTVKNVYMYLSSNLSQEMRVFLLEQETWISVFGYLQHSRRKQIWERKNFLEKYRQLLLNPWNTIVLKKLKISDYYLDQFSQLHSLQFSIAQSMNRRKGKIIKFCRAIILNFDESKRHLFFLSLSLPLPGEQRERKRRI